MDRMIFINLPVRDLARSRRFYESVGAENDPRFTDDTAVGMRISDTISVMLLSHAKFGQFTTRAIADAHRTAQALFCLSAADRAAVDAMVAAARGAGGVADPTPTQDFSFMYGRSFEDPDGHIWEVMWMDAAAFESAMVDSRASTACAAE